MNPEAIERLIQQGRDTPEARLAAGTARLKLGDLGRAIEHLTRAVGMRSDYTAAWQALGNVHRESGDVEQARYAWEKGIAVAQANGDKQSEKVMSVFLRRLPT